MALLYYWRGDNYRRDLEYGAAYHLNQANSLLHRIELGDSLWAFTRNRSGAYVLAAELVAQAKTINPPDFSYGQYRLWGDLEHSRYFATEEAPSAEPVIRSLSCRATAPALGQSFQGLAAVRVISAADHALLTSLARELSPEPRARLLPEAQLETTLYLGDSVAVASLIRENDCGIGEARRQYFYQDAPARNRSFVRMLQELYGGRCQLCGWDPRSVYGESLCEGHHIHWLSRGGDDVLMNMMLVCPNHHAAIHGCDAPLDYADLAFVFGENREPVRLDRHLMYAVS